MNRSQYTAVLIGLLAIGGLVAVNLGEAGPNRTAASNDQQASPVAPSTSEAASSNATGANPADANAGSAGDAAPVEPPLGAPPIDAPPVLGPAGDLVSLDGWLQTDATSFSDFAGTVRVVQFWTFGCINCKNTLGNLRSLYDELGPHGLEVIGVHAPEFEYEADPANIAQAAVDLGVTWPIALDTDKTNFRAWQPGRRFWPRTFVLDRAGNIRFDRIGEGAYDELNATVAFLLENPDA